MCYTEKHAQFSATWPLFECSLQPFPSLWAVVNLAKTIFYQAPSCSAQTEH